MEKYGSLYSYLRTQRLRCVGRWNNVWSQSAHKTSTVRPQNNRAGVERWSDGEEACLCVGGRGSRHASELTRA